MGLRSIRFKMMLPVILLALLLLGLFIFMQVVLKYENKAMETQTQSYFEAIAVVLNADRDIYQARLAQAELLTNYGDKAAQQKDFDENAQQVLERFHKYRDYLKAEPELLKPFRNFDQYYQNWLNSSNQLARTYQSKIKVNDELATLDKKFYTLRNILDEIEAKLRNNVSSWQKDEITQTRLKLYLDAIEKILNADRDMYQARLAQQNLMAGIGDYKANKILFEDNSIEAMNRFESFNSIMANEGNFIAKYANFTPMFSDWYKDSLAILNNGGTSQFNSDDELLKSADVHFAKVRHILDQAGEAVRSHGLKMEQEVIHTVEFVRQIAIIIIIIGFIIAFAMGYIIPRRITQNVNSISQRIKEISEGDGNLTERINSTAKDELGSLSAQFDKFLDNLQNIMRIIQDKSSALGQSTQQLDTVANSVNSITQILVDSCNSIVSSASEMSASNGQMASVASDTSNESSKASENINEGRQVVRASHQTIDSLVGNIDITMTKAEELEKNSQAISSVLEVIRGIAEQTNLLALNAAIEAARAGEFGRGFAVVADEVRTLATQTSESTNKIEEMINQLINSVNEAFNAIKMSKENASSAVSNFENVIAVFDALNTSLNMVRQLSEQTAQATNEQSEVSNEINVNLVSMKEQTDGVDHAANEIRTQFDTLNSLYQDLNEQVSKFKV